MTHDGIAFETLRQIDKLDKVGIEGVRARLTTGVSDDSGAFVEGVGMRDTQANAIVAFLDGSFGTGVEGMRRWFDLIGTRMKLMVALESIENEDGTTKFDELLSMPVCPNQTWEDGHRPENIGWAIDDIADCIRCEDPRPSQ